MWFVVCCEPLQVVMLVGLCDFVFVDSEQVILEVFYRFGGYATWGV